MRILVVKLSSLGDLFHALPAVHNLKVGLKADVDWVTQSEYADLVRCFEDVSDVIPFPRRRWARGFPEFARRLRLREYDLVVDLQGLMKSALVCRLARARHVLGPSFRREGAGLLYSAVAGAPDKDRHAVEENLDAVRFLGLERLPPAFPVRFPPAGVEGARPRVALLPVSRRANKNWPEEGFIAVGRGLRRDFGAQVYCLGGAADVPICAEIEQSVNAEPAGPRALNLAGRTGLVEMGSWLADMDLVIGNDSGPIHMAAAVGVPVVGVFGPTDPGRTGPYGAGHRAIVAESKCRPCHRRTCRFVATECLEQVTAEQVLAAAGEVLRARGAGGGRVARQHA
jgi:lipopolysaccharide heptosyltransferase I